MNDYSLFVTVDELQHYGDQLLLHWLREQEGYVDTRAPSRQLANAPDQEQQHQAMEEHQVDEQINNRVTKAARQLSIDHGDKRNEEHHRPTKKASFSKDEPKQHLPTPPGSSSPSHNTSSTSSSSAASQNQSHSRPRSLSSHNVPSRYEFYSTMS